MSKDGARERRENKSFRPTNSTGARAPKEVTRSENEAVKCTRPPEVCTYGKTQATKVADWGVQT